MRIGLIDVDGHGYPNLPLMKLSTWHKQRGDHVEWYNPNISGHMDKVYMSKVFSFTPDYIGEIDADVIEKGGSGYCISLINGKEVFDKSKHTELPYEIEHSYPDYSIYGITDTAYGFMSRGCPRRCDFCHVKDKEGCKSIKVADLSEFWNGQKNIVIMDPNTLACSDWRDILQQLIDSGAKVEFNQGLDIRVMTEEKAKMLNQIKLVKPHFAWDRYQDKDIVVPKFEEFVKGYTHNKRDIAVYVLTNFDTNYQQDVERVETIRSMGLSPYVMRYDKQHLKRGCYQNKLARYCNNRRFLWKYNSFIEYVLNEQETH